MEFRASINLNKCAACVVNKYCTHKTDKFDVLKIPYSKNDLLLNYVEFPEELKKDKT